MADKKRRVLRTAWWSGAVAWSWALVLLFIVNLPEFQPVVREIKPKRSVITLSLRRQFATCLGLPSKYLARVTYCRLTFLYKRYIARRAFEGTNIRQSANSSRSSDQCHGLSAMSAPPRV